jgi:hypothetical protein
MHASQAGTMKEKEKTLAMERKTMRVVPCLWGFRIHLMGLGLIKTKKRGKGGKKR